MKPSDPLTFVVGIVPFSRADSAPAKARRHRATSSTTSTTTDEAAPSALLPLVQLLARTAAREAFGVFCAGQDKHKD